MKVFKIRLNSNEYQSFLPLDSNVWKTDLLKMDCLPKLSVWKPPTVYITNPKLKKGSFFHLCSGAFLLSIPPQSNRCRLSSKWPASYCHCRFKAPYST